MADYRDNDPRFGEPITFNEVAGLTVALKALVRRAGGTVEIAEAELLAARDTLCRVDADAHVMRITVVAGAPPDVPRYAADERGASNVGKP